MGLLKHLLFWPVTGPTFLTRFSIEQVDGAVRTELTDDQAVKEELMQLQMELEAGAIGDEEYDLREAELMRRLRVVREWRERFGLPTAGGLVRVSDEARGEAGEDTDGSERVPEVARPEGAEIDVDLEFDED